MTRTFNILLLLIITIALISCNKSCGGDKTKKDKPTTIIVKGKFTNTKRDTIYLRELTPKDLLGVDSVVVNEMGEFQFSFKPKEDGFYTLGTSPKNFITLSLKLGETVEIAGDIRELAKTYTVLNSPESILLLDFNNKKRKNKERVDSLRIVFTNSQKHPEFVFIKMRLDSIYETIVKDQRQYARAFIEKNPTALASIIVLFHYFGDKPVLNSNDDFDMYEKLDKALMEVAPENQHVVDLHATIVDIKRKKAEKQLIEQQLALGAVAPEINLPNPEGKNIALSSLRGKIVLVDFWAAWCGPCRFENKHLVELYKRYNKKGFEIYSVSFDNDKKAWIAAIKRDNLIWTQVSDLLYNQSPVLKQFNIERIPANLLLDREGRIIDKNLFGKTLDYKLAEIFKPRSANDSLLQQTKLPK